MSPILAPPNRGTPDWQGAESWDGPLFYSDSPGSVAGPVNSGVIPVNGWAATAVALTLSAGECNLVLNWFADSAGTIPLGSRELNTASFIVTPFYGLIRNQGPFLVVELVATSGNFTPIVNVFGSNRVLTVETPPATAVLINKQSVPLGAGVTADVLPAYY